MTAEHEHDLDNALLTLMYEWKTGRIDQRQALNEFKHYCRTEDVIKFEESHFVDELRIKYYGIEKTIEYAKQEMSEKIAKEAIVKGCVSFEEVEHRHYTPEPYRLFRMKMEAIIQPQQKK